MDQTHKDNMHAVTKSRILFLCICALTSVTSQEVTCSRPQDRALSSRQSWRWWLNKLGDTVRYTCISGYRSTGGVTQATCTRDGWEPNPLCQEIKCRRQQFRNADVIGNIQAEYRYNDCVQYNCRRGYKGNFTLICGEDGWRGSNECTASAEIKCELTLPPLPGTTYEPANRNRFSPGEKVTVTCGERYWIVGTRTPSVETTCNEDGEWTVRPVCQEVTCSRPQDRLLSYWEVSWRGWSKKLGDTVRYTCRSGYKRKDGVTRATCTRDGWEPNPLCQEIPPCGTPPALEDGDTKTAIKEHYSHNETIEYMCQSYYIMEGEPYKTCLYGEWTGHMRCLRPCIVNEDEMRQHNITLKSSGTKYLVHDEIIEFRCTRGLSTGTVAMRQRCNSGVLVLPTCRE